MKLEIFNKIANDIKENNLVENFMQELSKHIENSKEKDKYITDISIGKAIRASSSFPVVFNPCEYKTHKFLDGGILDNVPAQEIKLQGANKVIAINFKADEINNQSTGTMEKMNEILEIINQK